jgi:hypothetical protein
MKSMHDLGVGQAREATSHTTILLPVGFNPTDHLPAGLWKFKDEIRLVVNWIATKSAMLYRHNNWIPLHHDQAIRLVGNNRRWSKLKPALLGCGVLECDGKWKRGEKSLWYRLQRPWCDANLVPYTVSEELADRLRCVEDIRSAHADWEPIHHHLEDWLHHVRIDEPAATRWTCRSSSPRQRRALKMVSIIQAGDPRMSVSQYGRVFSVVTQTPSRLRQYLRVDDQPLIEQDISSCQPLLLGMHCMHQLLSDITTGEQATRSSFYMGCNSAPISTHEEAPADLKEYIQTCENGEFYEELADVLGLPCKPGRDRKAVKREWYRLAYGQHNPDRRWEACIRRWPTIASAIEALKTDDHRNAARAMQKTESQIMIAGAANQIRQLHQDVPIVTVHDSVLTTAAMAGDVRGIILSNWERYGGKPKINCA